MARSPCLNQLDTSISFFAAKVFGPGFECARARARARGFAIGEVSSREKPTASGHSGERMTLSLKVTSNEGLFEYRAVSIDGTDDYVYNEKQIEMRNSRDDDFKRWLI